MNWPRIGPLPQMIQADPLVGHRLARSLCPNDALDGLAVVRGIGRVLRERDVSVENAAHRGLKQNRTVEFFGDGERSLPRTDVRSVSICGPRGEVLSQNLHARLQRRVVSILTSRGR